ncbi:hypothetical protein DY000_02014760 [Brassica cretica]|uniref:Uncharacterized protein n=1 Tax=Brassica cretica TaxID=69181 RepID=A0ABQ7D9U4_BRACR|nr:hypothetical protein DY000_02014760 [Brassica cretica]
MLPVKELIFKDAYVDAAMTKVLSDGSVNYVVELYDTALKETISKLKNAERLVRVKDSALNRKTSEFKAVIEKAEAEQSRLLAEKKAHKAKFTEKFGELKGKFKTAGEKIRSDGSVNYVVELYDTALKETISKLKNAERLVRVKDSALNRKTSEFKAVIEKAEAEQSRLLAEKKAHKAKFTEKFGELKGKFKTAGEKIRGSTVPPVLPSSDPGSAPLGESSFVNEEAPAREVGPGDADPVLPAEGRETRPGLDDLVELSDSSIERSGQNESSDGAPPGVGEDSNASSVERGERGSEDAIAQVPEEPESRSLEANPPISVAGVVENALDPVPRHSLDDPGRVEG